MSLSWNKINSSMDEEEDEESVEDSDDDNEDENKGTSPDDPLFSFTCLISAKGIHLSAHCLYGDRQILAFVTGKGDIVLYYIPAEENRKPVIKHIPWFYDGHKRITALCFSPSGTWLVTVVVDGSIFIVPALAIVDPKAVSDERWATNDVTAFPNIFPVRSPVASAVNTPETAAPATCNSHKATEATAAVWWQSLQDFHHVIIIGTNQGDLHFFSLTSGMLVGSTFVASPVEVLHVCEDNIQESVALLIIGEHQKQWRLLLEQSSSSYCWPFENAKPTSSTGDLSSSSQGSYDIETSSRNSGQLPTARSRLQGLKQLSVEKLASIKQKLAETRSRGATAFSNLRKESNSSITTEESNKTRKSSVTSEGSSEFVPPRMSSGPQPESVSCSLLANSILWPQKVKGRNLLSSYHIRLGILTVHSVSMELSPLFVYHLPPETGSILITDKLLFLTDVEKTSLMVVSCPLAEGRPDGDSDYNAESIIETVAMNSNEEITAVYLLKYSQFVYKGEPFEDEIIKQTEDSESDDYEDSDGEEDDGDNKRSMLEKVINRINERSVKYQTEAAVQESNIKDSGSGKTVSANISKKTDTSHSVDKRADTRDKNRKVSNPSVTKIRRSESRSSTPDTGRASEESKRNRNSNDRCRNTESEGECEKEKLSVDKEIEMKSPPVDTCLIVTNAGIYEIRLRRPITEIFMDLVLNHRELEKAERLARAFGLNLHELLELAADKQLSEKQFIEALGLYKLSKCRSLKSVLKFAAAGHCAEILDYILSLLTANSMNSPSSDAMHLSTSERMHMSNMVVMCYMEQMLRYPEKKLTMFKLLLNFLNNNMTYDESLTVTIAGQTKQWDVVQFMSNYRGLYLDALDVVSEVLYNFCSDFAELSSDAKDAGKLSEILNSSLWSCISDTSLLQGLLCKQSYLKNHLKYTETFLPYLKTFALERLAAFYDPSSSAFRIDVFRMLKSKRRRAQSGGSLYSSLTDTVESTELSDSADETRIPVEDVIQMFLLVLLYLVKERSNNYIFLPDLMHQIQVTKNRNEDEDLDDLLPSLPVQSNVLSTGFSHVALIRNGVIYTWGLAAHGCLGTGPTMSRHSEAKPVSLFVSLRLEVVSIYCGKQHTLALTNNGVYVWGNSKYGQLGIGKVAQSPYPKLVERLSQERIVAISAGQYHSLALTEDGRVYTWGWGVHGQLGHGTVEDCHYPVLVKDLIGNVVVQICGGHAHSLVLTAEGEIYTFGSSVFGQLGTGSITKSSKPVKVASLNERICIIASGYFHSLAVSISNKLYIWGSSPQVLRLQAQAQKRMRMLTQNADKQECYTDTSSSVSPAKQNPGWKNPNGSLPSSSVETGTGSPTCVKKSLSEISFQSSSETDSKSTPATPLSRALTREKLRSFILSNTRSEKRKALQQSQSSSPVYSNISINKSNTAPVDLSLILSGKSDNYSFDKKLSSNNLCIEDIAKDPKNISKITLNGSVRKIPSDFQMAQIKTNGLCNNNEKSLSDASTSSSMPDRIAGGDCPVTIDEECQKDKGSEKNLELKNIFPGVETSTEISDAYVMSSVVMSPTLEFKGLISSPISPEDKESKHTKCGDVDAAESSSSNTIEDNQLHLTPQLVDTSLVNGAITQISCGCHHSALLTKDGDLYVWGRNIDGQLGNGSRKEVQIPTQLSVMSTYSSNTNRSPSSRRRIAGGIPAATEKLKFQKVCCGCEYTMAMTIESSGAKLYACGSNGNGQLGKPPSDEGRDMDGKLVMLRTAKRVIKLPRGSGNVIETPKEVPGIPSSSISFKGGCSEGQSMPSCKRWSSLGGCQEICPPLCSLEKPCYGRYTLHFTLQRFHGYYDSKYLLSKCLELEDYQAAARLVMLDRHYHLALAYQLKALALAASEASDSLQPEISLTEKCDSTEKPLKHPPSGTEHKDNSVETAGASTLPLSTEISCDSEEKLSAISSNIVVLENTDDGSIADSKAVQSLSCETKTHEDSSNTDFRPENDTVVKELLQSEEIGPDAASIVVEVKDNVIQNENLKRVADGFLTNGSRPGDEIHVFAIQGGKEQMSDGGQYVPSPESTSSLAGDDKGSHISTEITSNGVDTSTNLACNENNLPCNVTGNISVNVNNNISLNQDLSVSDQKPEKFSTDTSGNLDSFSVSNVLSEQNMCGSEVDKYFINSFTKVPVVSVCNPQHLKVTKNAVSFPSEPESLPSVSEVSPSVELSAPREESATSNSDMISQASAVVEYYMSIMEDDSHSMMSKLLEQGFEFWLDHSLPVPCLESLLAKHMSRFSYPLGLLLFGTLSDNGRNVEEPSAVTSMLNRLSSHFSLQLCSMLLAHINQKRDCPEYVEQLAKLTSVHTSSHESQLEVSTGLFNPGQSQSQDQLMEIILQNLGATQQGNSKSVSKQACITLREEEIVECTNGENTTPNRVYVFSCGHSYSDKEFEQETITELNQSLLQLNQPLPDTVSLLRSLYSSDSSVIDLACPKCVSNHLKVHIT